MGEYNMLILRALSAVAAAALGATVIMAMPGFSPPVAARTTAAVEPAPLPGASEQRTSVNPCSEQAWPYYAASCLHGQSSGPVRTVRLVTTDRLPK
jgi:hypothetical protein